MSNSHIPLSLWIDAHLRRLNEIGQGYYIVQKGDYDSRGLIVKISLLNGLCKVLTRIRDENGELAWMNALKDETVAESEADAYIRRAASRDSDLWVIEIEDRNGANPFDGKIII